jgi:hypothetical protein
MAVLKNNIVKAAAQKSLFDDARNVIGSSLSFTQGDLLVMDTSTHLLRAPTIETEGSIFVGVARVSIVNGKLPSPYNTDVVGSQSIQDIPGPVYGVVCKLQLKTGDSLNPGDAVYLDPGTGTQGVTATGTKQVGIYQGPAISSAPAGSLVEVLVGARFGGDTLKF